MWKSWIWRYWLGWLGRTVASVVLVCFLCIWTTGYIVNSYIKAFLKQYDISLAQEPFTMAGLWGVLWGGRPEPAAEGDDFSLPAWSVDRDTTQGAIRDTAPGAGHNTGKGTDQDPGQGAGNDATKGTGSGAAQGAGQGKTQEADKDIAKREGDGAAPETGQGQGDGYEAGRGPVQGTGREAGQETGQGSGQGTGPEPGRGTTDRETGPGNGSGGSERLSDEERQRLYATLLNKLSADQLNRLSEWLEGGLTDEEAADLETMLREVLTETEVRQFMEIIGPMREDFPAA